MLPVVAIAIWWAISAAHLVKSGLLVSPAQVLATAWDQVTSGALVRALSASLAREASGFVIRRILDRSGFAGRRIIATGGGSRSVPWMQAVADATGLPVDTVAVPEGAALGAAFLARMAAGLETSFDAAAGWAQSGRRIEPDPAWTAAASERYRRFDRWSEVAETLLAQPLPPS